MRALLCLLLLCPCANALAATPVACLAVAPLPMTVQIGMTARQVLLIVEDAPALRIVDTTNGDTLWTGGATTGVTQRFAGMTAPFAGSFIALDTNRDGLHDRLYAGDLAGRIWRIDLHNGSDATAWASGGIFADFSNEAGRGFIAPPDVSLATAPGHAPWFNIAIGTAAPGVVNANNRFYVLRDRAPFESWSDQQHQDWQPLRERDLVRVNPMEPVPADVDTGWFVELGHGDVLSAALTVAGRTVFAISEPVMDVAGCRSAFSIATASLDAGQIELDIEGNWRRRLTGDMTLDTAFVLAVVDADAVAAAALCSFGGARVGECDVDLKPRRTWWRREDTE